MKVLVGCEESQIVCKAFREKGHQAFSCDFRETSGNNNWHLRGDVIPHLNDAWDMFIGFPPCTHLAVSGAKHFEKKRNDGRQQEGIDFFMVLINAPIEKIAIENPIGIMSSVYEKPTQIIHPYYFGDAVQKSTCLWLKNLPQLKHYKKDDMFNKKTWVDPEIRTLKNGVKMDEWYYQTGLITIKDDKRAKARSKTFQGIANAMAEQWG